MIKYENLKANAEIKKKEAFGRWEDFSFFSAHNKSILYFPWKIIHFAFASAPQLILCLAL